MSTALGSNEKVAGLPREIASGSAHAVQGTPDVVCSLCLGVGMEDLLTTVGEHNHLIRPLAPDDRLVLCLVLDRTRTNRGAAG